MGEEGCWVGFFLFRLFSLPFLHVCFLFWLFFHPFSISFLPPFSLFFSLPFPCLLSSPLCVFPLSSVLVRFKPSQLLMTRGFADCSN